MKKIRITESQLNRVLLYLNHRALNESAIKNKKRILQEAITLDKVAAAFKDKIVEKFGSDKVFNDVIDIVNGKYIYAQFLLKHLLTGSVLESDIYKYEEYFDTFERRKRDYPSTNILDYGYREKDITRARQEIEKFNTLSIQFKEQEQDDPTKASGIERSEKFAQFKIGEVAGFDVYEIPKGRTDLYDTSCDLGRGTSWCTATGKVDHYFKDYIQRNSLFIFISKTKKPGGREKYQIFLGGDGKADEFKDRYDNEVTIDPSDIPED